MFMDSPASGAGATLVSSTAQQIVSSQESETNCDKCSGTLHRLGRVSMSGHRAPRMVGVGPHNNVLALESLGLDGKLPVVTSDL